MSAYQGLTLAIACAVIGIIFGGLWAMQVVKQPDGNDRMREIAAAISTGATAYLWRQYKTIAIVGVVLFVIMAIFLHMATAIGFAIGAILSGAAGVIGMNVSVRANVRTAEAARTGLNEALQIAFRGGAITGLLVVGLGMLGVAGFFAVLYLGSNNICSIYMMFDQVFKIFFPGAEIMIKSRFIRFECPGQPLDVNSINFVSSEKPIPSFNPFFSF